MHIHFNDLYSHALAQDPDSNKTILVDSWNTWKSLLYHQFVWSKPGSREDFHRNNLFSQYNLYGHTLAQETLPQGSWNLQFW